MGVLIWKHKNGIYRITNLKRFILIIGIIVIADVYTVFRVLSTNVAKRRYEADRFTSFFKKDPYKRFKCPKCKTLCRVPRDKGKIKIHCPSCGHEFIKRT